MKTTTRTTGFFASLWTQLKAGDTEGALDRLQQTGKHVGKQVAQQAEASGAKASAALRNFYRALQGKVREIFAAADAAVAASDREQAPAIRDRLLKEVIPPLQKKIRSARQRIATLSSKRTRLAKQGKDTAAVEEELRRARIELADLQARLGFAQALAAEMDRLTQATGKP
ncbi:MAG: hypothetical protein HY520_01485 [Candidatus Aenigmarchaeota archaeon]|nr:hypothetical protein [Candidatus Aenigmarchaeota archaeon]